MSRLVVSRRVGEAVDVAGPAKVTIVGLRGSLVRIAFDAPDTTRILRQELLDQQPKGREEDPCES